MSGRDVTVHSSPAGIEQAQGADETATSLVRMAIEKNVSVDVIERLVALQERVTDRNARGAYFEALAAFQDECPEIAKSKKANITGRNGSSFSYSYAPLDVVARTIRPVLRKHGLSYNFDVSQEGSTLIISCVVRHIDGHSERSSFPVPVDKGGRMSDAQANGAALTYGKRQALVAALGLTTADADTDGKDSRRSGNDDGGGEKLISKEQVATLEEIIEAGDHNKKRFLAWLGYESLSDIPAFEFDRARKALLEAD